MMGERIRQRIGKKWEGKTPGFHLKVLLEGKCVADERFGVTYPVYDWASLTKMVLTLTLTMKCIDEGLFHESDLVGKFLPELKDNHVLQIRHLLSHCAGLPGSIHFWNQHPEDSTKIAVEWRRRVLELKMSPSERSSYTELDFQVIGYILDSILGTGIESHWQKLSTEMGMMRTKFRPLNCLSDDFLSIAPTEICPLREKRIQGEVHHPDIWLNGGVGWLSGLFGPLEDLATWALGLRHTYYGGEDWIVRPATLQRFTTREVGNSSLGFMMPKLGRRTGQKYYLSSGEGFGPSSIGHTGYTGPMFWFDPDRDLIVLILTNRTFPSALNEEWFDFRGVVHDDICTVIDESQVNEFKIKELIV